MVKLAGILVFATLFTTIGCNSSSPVVSGAEVKTRSSQDLEQAQGQSRDDFLKKTQQARDETKKKSQDRALLSAPKTKETVLYSGSPDDLPEDLLSEPGVQIEETVSEGQPTTVKVIRRQ